MLSLSHKIENVFLRGVKWLAWVTQLVGFKYRSSSLQSSVASQSLPKMELLYSSTCNVCPHRRWGLKRLSDLLNGEAVRNNHRAIVAPIPTLVTNSYLFSAEDKELHQILCVCVQLLGCVQLFATLWTIAHQALLSMGVLGQEYWSELSFPPSKDLPNPGIESMSPTFPVLQVNSLPQSHWGSPPNTTGQITCRRWGPCSYAVIAYRRRKNQQP